MNQIKNQWHGTQLLANPQFNKGTAFSQTEREKLGLVGLLPPRVETIEEQAMRVYALYLSQNSDLDKHLFLNRLFAINTTLFYYLASQHLIEMLPIIYTPTIGDAVKHFSHNFINQQGLIIALDDQDKIENILAHIDPEELDIAVVTDGEGVLGIGDQGAGGLNIAIGKLMVYTLCGGINPFRTLPIQLDVGTNNEELLADPLYLGLRRQRARGQEYLNFIDKFVSAFHKRFPHSFLHWEDFGRDNARAVLDRYRTLHQSFNDDIQGTGAVTLAAVLAGIKRSGLPADRHRFCIYGAGTAGCGIADQISQSLAKSENKDVTEIRRRFYLLNSKGLLGENSRNLLPFQQPYAIATDQLRNWQIKDSSAITLAEVVHNAKPTVLIGCSTQADSFTEEILAEMAKNSDRPIILPLSNPTAKSETTPKRIFAVCNGKASIATGSPFSPISWQGREIPVSQCNNALVFPGIGLGMLISRAKQLTDSMLLVASTAVSDATALDKNETQLLPGFNNILQLSRSVAMAVAREAIHNGVAEQKTDKELEAAFKKHTWQATYQNLNR